MTGIPVDASKREFIAAKTLRWTAMKSLKAALRYSAWAHRARSGSGENFGYAGASGEALEKSVDNVEKYLEGNWIFQGSTSDC